jgi:hypothetical protein
MGYMDALYAAGQRNFQRLQDKMSRVVGEPESRAGDDTSTLPASKQVVTLHFPPKPAEAHYRYVGLTDLRRVSTVSYVLISRLQLADDVYVTRHAVRDHRLGERSIPVVVAWQPALAGHKVHPWR